MPVVATHEVVSDVFVPVAVTLESVSKFAPTTSEPNVIIVTDLGTGTIPLLAVMMSGMATLSHSSTTRLVFSRKFNPDIFFSTSFYFCPYVMGCI